jgi:hypothetical protein
MLKLDPVEVAFELTDLSAVSTHCVFDTIPLLVDLLADDLGVAICQYPLDAKGHCDTEPMD